MTLKLDVEGKFILFDSNISIKLKNILKDLIDDESKYIFENLIDTNKLFNDINLIPSWTSLKHIIFINKFEKCLGKKLTSNEISNFKLISDFDNLIKNLKDWFLIFYLLE